MESHRRTKSPRQVAVVFAAFFLAYGVYARWLSADAHPLYAFASWGMGLLWVILAFTSGTEKPS
jgi:hypothetical protein